MAALKAAGELFARFAIALAVSSIVLVIETTLLRLSSASFALYVVPIAIGAGLLPLIYWYRRDAYPAGLIFVPAAYVWLRLLASLLGLGQ